MPWEPEYDTAWDSPKALAKWRVEGFETSTKERSSFTALRRNWRWSSVRHARFRHSHLCGRAKLNRRRRETTTRFEKPNTPAEMRQSTGKKLSHDETLSHPPAREICQTAFHTPPAVHFSH